MIVIKSVKKRGKRRGLTPCEALDEENADERRRRSAQSVEQAQIQNFLALSQTYTVSLTSVGASPGNRFFAYIQAADNR